MRRVVIGKAHFAVGLQWGLGSSRLTLSDLRQEAKRMDPDFDALAFRQRQHGFGATPGGNVLGWRNVRALAASIQVPSTSFLGLFRLEDGDGPYWWMFAMSQSLIVGMGDRVFASRQEAEAAILSLRGLMDADFDDRIICDTLEESLAWLTPLLGSWFRARLSSRRSPFLVPLYPQPERRKTILLAAGLVVGLMGGGYALKSVLEHRGDQKRAEAMRLVQLSKEQQRRALQAHPEKVFPQPWLTAPDVGGTLRQAVGAILRLPTVVNGWELEGVHWEASNLVMSWGFRSGASFVRLPRAAKVDSPSKCTSRLPFPAVRRSSDVVATLLSRQDCTQRFYYAVQAIGCRLKLSFNPPEKKVVDNVEMVAPWLSGQWEFNSIPAAVIADASFPEAFTDMPGMILGRIELSKDVWSMKGAVYVVDSAK